MFLKAEASFSLTVTHARACLKLKYCEQKLRLAGIFQGGTEYKLKDSTGESKVHAL